MKDNVILSKAQNLDPATDAKHNKEYEITISLTQEQISNILDFRLIQKMEQNNESFDEYLAVAERIKSPHLSDQFCRFFSTELTPLLHEVIHENTDSYAITNFQYRMLRKFTKNETPL